MKFEVTPDIKGLIFDLDGTLADSMPLHVKAWIYAANHFGVEFTTSFLRNHTGTPAWKIASILLEEQGMSDRVDVTEFLQKKNEGYYSIQDQVKAVEPVADVVRRYYNSMPMAVGTGGHREAVERTLEVTGLRKYFDIVVTANDVSNHKPHPETFLKCAGLMNVNPSSIMVFEDGELGIEAAEKAGMKPVDVRSWYKSDWYNL
jgi:beta-phosphoglucomutase family hydrolase